MTRLKIDIPFEIDIYDLCTPSGSRPDYEAKLDSDGDVRIELKDELIPENELVKHLIIDNRPLLKSASPKQLHHLAEKVLTHLREHDSPAFNQVQETFQLKTEPVTTHAVLEYASKLTLQERMGLIQAICGRPSE